MNNFKNKKIWLSVTTIISAFSLGLCVLCAGRCLSLLIIAIIASMVSIYLKKSISKEEHEKQEELSLKAFVAGILIPIGIILLLLMTFVGIVIWKTYR